MATQTHKKTYSAKPGEVERAWWVVDAENQTLGRLATQVANLIRGKHKPIFTPHIDTGDFVVVINADKIQVSGKKAEQKKYYRHSGYPGGFRETAYKDMKEKFPERVIEKAVFGMIPNTRLGREQRNKLNVYRGPEHPHQAQKPQEYKLIESKQLEASST